MSDDDFGQSDACASSVEREAVIDHEIHLLAILSVDPATHLITCHLQQFSTEVEEASHDIPLCPTYDALSYAWGPATPQRTILLNGTEVSIRENLWQFLYHAGTESINILPPQKGSPNEETYRLGWLWVDALCIDQQDVAVRNRQVQRMSSVYQKATRVISWVGEAADGSDEALRFVNRAVKTYCHLNDTHQWPRNRDNKKPGAWLESTPHERRGLLSLLARPYWTRLWVVQEVALAERPFTACGRVMLESWDLTYFHWTLSAPWLLHDEFTGAVSQNWPWLVTPFKYSIERRKRQCRERPDPGLFLHVLERFSDRDCDDPRDKVFGLIGLADPRHVLRVDYSLHPAHVFWEAIKFCVEGLPKFSQPAIRRLAATMGVTGFEGDVIDETAASNLDAIYDTHDFTTALHQSGMGPNAAFAEVCQRILDLPLSTRP